MRIGYLIALNGGPYDQPLPDRSDVTRKLDAMIEEGIEAEQAGYHSAIVHDQHGRTETYFPGPLQLLTLLARATDRVAIGTTLVLTLYPPMLVAEQSAVIDNLSRGRLFLSMARGYHPDYWKYFGVPQDRMLARFREALELVRLAYGRKRFSFKGDFFQATDALLSPPPYQAGGVPFWGGGGVPRSIRRAAEFGEAWMCSPFPLEKETWDEQVEAYRSRAREVGKKPFVVLMRDGWVADSYSEAVREFGSDYVEELKYYHRMGILSHHKDFDSLEKITPEACRPHLVLGSAENCISQIEALERDYGVDYVVMVHRKPTGPSFERTRDQIRRFGAEVAAYFNERDPGPLIHPAIPEGARW